MIDSHVSHLEEVLSKPVCICVLETCVSTYDGLFIYFYKIKPPTDKTLNDFIFMCAEGDLLLYATIVTIVEHVIYKQIKYVLHFNYVLSQQLLFHSGMNLSFLFVAYDAARNI